MLGGISGAAVESWREKKTRPRGAESQAKNPAGLPPLAVLPFPVRGAPPPRSGTASEMDQQVLGFFEPAQLLVQGQAGAAHPLGLGMTLPA